MNFGVVSMDNIHVPADVPDELIDTYLDNMAAATAGTVTAADRSRWSARIISSSSTSCEKPSGSNSPAGAMAPGRP